MSLYCGKAGLCSRLSIVYMQVLNAMSLTRPTCLANDMMLTRGGRAAILANIRDVPSAFHRVKVDLSAEIAPRCRELYSQLW
jgi:hypothetical protein